jgi:predicted RND superfamily exporter protein
MNSPAITRSGRTSALSLISKAAIRHPRSALLAAALVTLAAVPGLRDLRLRTDGHALVSPDAPEVVYDKSIRGQFNLEDQIVVLIGTEGEDGIFNPGTLQLVRELTAELMRLPGVNPSNVMSLATEPSFHMRPGSLIHQTLLEPPLKTKAELEELREDLRRIELYNGTLVSTDSKSTCILVGTPEDCDRAALYRQVLGAIGKRPASAEKLSVTGAPVAEALLGVHILEDLGVPKALLASGGAGGETPMSWKFPRNLYDMRLLIARGVGLVPVAVVVMVLVFLAAFRNLVATLIPLPGVAAGLLFTFGMMGWCGVPVYLTTAVIPVLLTVISVTNDIYLFSRYFGLLRERPKANHIELVGETFEKLARPVACTSLTAVAGFLSFGLSPLAPVRAFGWFTGVGALFGLGFSLTAVPALLTLVNPAWLRSTRERGSAWPLASVFARIGAFVVRRKWRVFGVAAAVMAMTPIGLRRLHVQDSWISGFDEQSEFRRVTSQVNNQFFGMHLLFVTLDQPETARGEVLSTSRNQDGVVLPGNLVENPTLIAGSSITISAEPKPGTNGAAANPPLTQLRSHIEMVYGFGNNISARIPTRDTPTNFWVEFAKAGKARFEVVVHTQCRPQIVQALGDLAVYLRTRRDCAVGGVLGPYEYVTTTRFMARPNDPTARALPKDPAEIKLMWDYYGIARGQQRLHQIVDTNYWQSVTTVFLKDANFADTARLLDGLRAYEREKLTPQGIKLGFAGDVAVSQSLIHGIVTTQLQSLAWSLAGVFFVTACFGGSLRWGVCCLLPSLLAVVVKFAVMGWLDIPLGVATSMFAAMTLGIGVNCAIHLMESWDQTRAGGATSVEALTQALSLTGAPALINTLAVSLGFGVLMLSQVPANARLGILLVLGLVNCFVASVLLLPLLLHWWPGRVKKTNG